MPLLDIAKFKCVHFMLEGRLAVPDSPAFFNKAIGRRITPQNPYQCEESYNISKSYHQVQALVERVGRGYDLTIHFDSTPGDEGEPSVEQKASELLEALSGLQIESTFSYDIVFEFGKDVSSRFFPLKLPILSGAVIDEFRGFIGVKKHQNGKIAYTLSLESPELKESYVNVQFDYSNTFNLASFESRLKESVSIVQNLIPSEES